MEPIPPIQNAESYSVPRRPLDIEDYIDILRRHKAWILGPTFAAIVVAVVVAFVWPDTYVSTAVLRVVPPQVPQEYVKSNVNAEMSQRINSMAQTILSRGTLTNIVNTYGLYPRLRSRLPLEDIVEEMRRRDINIANVVTVTQSQGGRQIPAFQISFSYESRNLAQKVCADLVSRFINENTRDRANSAVSTTQFLKDQVDATKKELELVEDKLAQFRTKRMGSLPDQMTNNLSQLNVLEQRMTNLNGQVSRINQEKLLLESQLRIFKDQLNAMAASPGDQQTVQQQQVAVDRKNERLMSLEHDITILETRLAALKEVYRESPPDVKREMSSLNVLKKERDALLKAEESKKPAEKPAAAPAPLSPSPQFMRESRDLEASIRKLQSQIEAKELEGEETARELARVDQQIKLIQSRIDATPMGEKEYVDLVHDRDSIRARYEDLNNRQSQSRIATELENRQQGETLELLDPASLPITPTEPKRPLWVAIGSVLGVAAGFVLAGVREMKNSSLKNLKDVRAYTQFTVLGSIPLLENDLVVRRRRRLGWLAWSTAVLLGCLVMSGSLYYYYFVVKV
jgi:polysaccharide chain length determinant protein (PEP-CTERM system associated)